MPPAHASCTNDCISALPSSCVKGSLGRAAGVQTARLQSKSTEKVLQCLYANIKHAWKHSEIANYHSRRYLHGIMGWKMTILCSYEHPGITFAFFLLFFFFFKYITTVLCHKIQQNAFLHTQFSESYLSGIIKWCNVICIMNICVCSM